MLRLLCLLFCLSLIACGESETDRIGDAQICLDNAEPHEAQDCVSGIESSTRTSANVLKCSAGFITESFGSGDRFKRSFQKLNDSNEGTPGLLGYFTFSSQSTALANRDFAAQTNAYCQAAGQKVLKLLGSIALTATTISALGGLTWDANNPPTAADIQNAIDTLKAAADPDSVAAVQQIGRAALVIVSDSCSKGNVPNKKLCDQYDKAVAGETDPDQIGQNLLEIFKNNQ